MLEVLSVNKLKDKNGKEYHRLCLFSPETLEPSKSNAKIKVRTKSRKCSYIAYPINYTTHQGSDFGFDLEEGDEIEGHIVTKKVKPYIANNELQTTCTVPVFATMDDPIDFEIKMEEAIVRAGRLLEDGELKYGDPELPLRDIKEIPDTCLIVNVV